MSPLRALYIAIGAVLLLGCLWEAWGGPLDETRYCAVTPHRDADGSGRHCKDRWERHVYRREVK